MRDTTPSTEPLIMLSQDRQGTLRYLQALRAHWLLIVVLVAVTVASAAAYSFTATPRYDASADVLVTPVSAGDETFVGFSLLREGIEQARSVVTAARIAESPEIVEAVDRRLGRTDTGGTVDVEPLGQSNIVAISATADDADEAAEVANAYAEAFVDLRSAQFQRELTARIELLNARLRGIPDPERDFEAVAIQQRLAELNSLVGASDPTLRILSDAVPPGSASWPRPVLSMVVALLAALLLGGGAAIALEVTNPRVSREDELLLTHRLPILTRVPRLSPRLIRKYQLQRKPLPAGAQKAYRTLRANLATAGMDMKPPETILVTSASPGEGKTMTSVNLALTLASAGKRVVLVDSDVHRPMVATMFGVTGRRDGFARLFGPAAGVTNTMSALVPSPSHGERLKLALASPEQMYALRTLDRDRVARVIEQLKEQADVIVFDSPPLPEVAEAVALADAVDAVLIAVRLGHTRRDRLEDLRRMLALRGVTPLGFVVTTRERYTASSDSYYYAPDVATPTANGRQSGDGRSDALEVERRQQAQ